MVASPRRPRGVLLHKQPGSAAIWLRQRKRRRQQVNPAYRKLGSLSMAKSKYKWGPLALAASGLAIASAIAVAALPQASTLNITLTGQSMIRGDIRVHTPAAAATI